MIHDRLNTRLRSLVLLSLFAGTLLGAAPAPAAVRRQIPYSFTTKLSLSPTPRTFRFSLLRENGTVAWQEEKAYTLRTSKTVKHNLGSVRPFTDTHMAEFSQQLRVRLQYKSTPTKWTTLSTTYLPLAPYAVCSATSETPGPALACWDLDASGAGECKGARFFQNRDRIWQRVDIFYVYEIIG